jgi:hypothetical protein
MNQFRRFWASFGYFFWPGLGVLYVILGLREIFLGISDFWSYVDIGSGVIITIITLSIIKCSNCGTPMAFRQVWSYVLNSDSFSCNVCRTTYEIPLYCQIFIKCLTLIIALVVVMPLFFKQFSNNSDTLLIAFMFVVIRFMGYKKLPVEQF